MFKKVFEAIWGQAIKFVIEKYGAIISTLLAGIVVSMSGPLKEIWTWLPKPAIALLALASFSGLLILSYKYVQLLSKSKTLDEELKKALQRTTPGEPALRTYKGSIKNVAIWEIIVKVAADDTIAHSSYVGPHCEDCKVKGVLKYRKGHNWYICPKCDNPLIHEDQFEPSGDGAVNLFVADLKKTHRELIG